MLWNWKTFLRLQHVFKISPKQACHTWVNLLSGYSQSASLTTVTMATPNHCTCVLLYSHYFALLLLNSNYLEGLFYFHHFCSSLPYTGVGHVFMSLFFQDMYLYCLLCLLLLSFKFPLLYLLFYFWLLRQRSIAVF